MENKTAFAYFSVVEDLMSLSLASDHEISGSISSQLSLTVLKFFFFIWLQAAHCCISFCVWHLASAIFLTPSALSELSALVLHGSLLF